MGWQSRLAFAIGLWLFPAIISPVRVCITCPGRHVDGRDPLSGPLDRLELPVSKVFCSNIDMGIGFEPECGTSDVQHIVIRTSFILICIQ